MLALINEADNRPPDLVVDDYGERVKLWDVFRILPGGNP